MLARPLQSPCLPSSNDEPPYAAIDLHNSTVPSSDLLSTDTRPSQLHAEAAHKPSHSAPNHNPNSLARSTKGRKRTLTDDDNHEEESSHQTRRTKRQPQAILAADHKQEPIPTTETTRDRGRNVPKASRTTANARPRRKKSFNFSSAPRSLPWKSCSRGTMSDRQTGAETKTWNHNRGL
ncbi:hypothetical protein BDR22DRAFT_187967 [Usnea florida]